VTSKNNYNKFINDIKNYKVKKIKERPVENGIAIEYQGQTTTFIIIVKSTTLKVQIFSNKDYDFITPICE
ncbi:MAG: hypothetical protein NTX03_00695, partial [Bacteroidetes bacterium]|nr:hypothetical protein [Bacteroidota bacterium]